jgi:hypothetical protein
MGVFCYQDNQFITYSNNIFDTLYNGILSGSATVGATNSHGSLYSKATGNKFLNINSVGLKVDAPTGTTTATGFVSNGNLFSNVGNGISGSEGGQIIECITFTGNATGCVSTNDRFTRFDQAQTKYSTSTFYPLVRGSAIVLDDTTSYRYRIRWATTSTLIRIPYLSTMTGVTIEYQMWKSTGFRKGELSVLASPYLTGTVTYTDKYNYFGTEPGVILSAKLINSTNTSITSNFDCIAIQYENNSTTMSGNTGTGNIDLTIKYQT